MNAKPKTGLNISMLMQKRISVTGADLSVRAVFMKRKYFNFYFHLVKCARRLGHINSL